MSGNSFDEQGEAHEALSTAVKSYGARVLGDPRVLGNMVGDMLPDLPREASLLVTAAEAGVAGELVQHVEQQHLDVDTAIQLVARSLTERRSLDAAASTWVTSEYARALGYPVRAPAGQGSPSAKDTPGAPPTVTMQAMSPVAPPPVSPQVAPMPVPPSPAWPSPGAQGQPGQPMRAPVPPPQPQPQAQPPFRPQAQPPFQGQPPFPPQGQAPFPPQGQPAPRQDGPVPPMQFPQPPYGGPPPAARTGGKGPSGPKRGLFAGGAVVGVIVLYLIVAAVAHAFPFAKHTPKPTPTPTITTPPPTPTPTPSTPTPTPTTPTPTPTTSLAAGVLPISTLLPTDLDDISMECAVQHTSFPWAMPGLVTALKCTDPGLPGGQVFAFQLNSSANYQTAWDNFNKWWGFDLSTAGTVCPPTGSDTQGTTEWKDKQFPYRNGQVLECETVGSGSTTQASYTWTFPTEDGFIIAQAAHTWTFSQLNT